MARSRAARRSHSTIDDPAGALPARSGSQAQRNVMLSNPGGEVAESIQALRARVQTRHVQAGRRALAMCGPTPEVGCSFVTVNLAVALAQVGIKTLLVDGDMRNPTVHTYFELGEPGPGLRGCLLSPDTSIADFVHQDVLPNLDVLVAGEPDRTANELLAGDEFPRLVNECLRDYDLTIIDTPPANSCADSLLIGTVVGFSLIVARKQRTLVSDVKVLVDQLKKERVRAIGTVLNAY